jgi:hypothetical protein
MASRSLRAWIIRWEWAGQHAAVEQPVAAILRPQIGGDQLLRVVETLYAAREYVPDEMLETIRRNGHNPYRAEWGTIAIDLAKDGRPLQVPWQGEVICGHNPFLVARLGRAWPVGDGSGQVEWDDDPRPAPEGGL